MDCTCILCDTPMKECIVWPFLMEYCHNCLTFRVSGVPSSLKATRHTEFEKEFNKQMFLDIIDRVPEERVTLCFPKLSKRTLCDRWYFSINSIDQFLKKHNKERFTNMCICNVQLTDTDITITVTNVAHAHKNILHASLVDALNEEIHNNVYDESMYSRIFVKSILARFLVSN